MRLIFAQLLLKNTDNLWQIWPACASNDFVYAPLWEKEARLIILRISAY